MKKYNFDSYLHFDTVTVNYPENRESFISGSVNLTSRVNRPRALKRGN